MKTIGELIDDMAAAHFDLGHAGTNATLLARCGTDAKDIKEALLAAVRKLEDERDELIVAYEGCCGHTADYRECKKRARNFLHYSDREPQYCDEHLADGILSCVLDHSYDRTSLYFLNEPLRTALRKSLDEIYPEWQDRTIPDDDPLRDRIRAAIGEGLSVTDGGPPVKS